MMISYAQNGEDVLLRRLFPSVRDGFFIDVGANDPVDLSVTKHFYDQGWHGINIEPLRQGYERLCAERPRDRNLNMGVGRCEGSLTLYELPESPVLSTFSAEQAALYRAAGKAVVERSVPVQSLASICAAHVDRPIHFLSIDVEGWEQPVLEGADWTRWRPMVVLVEATRPDTNVPTHHEWEPLLSQAGYLFAYFDGLNRFYVRAENPELLEGFRVPLNIGDEYIWFPYQRQLDTAWGHLVTTKGHLESVRAQLDAALAREQATVAREQATVAREQATVAREQAGLAREAELLGRLCAQATQIEQLNALLAEVEHRLREALARLAPYVGVGRTAILIGQLLRNSARRFPRLAGVARRMLRGSAKAFRGLAPRRAA